MKKPPTTPGLIARFSSWCKRSWDYFNQGVWEDARQNWRVATIKTLSLATRSFLNSQLWVRAAALTYNTVLALVPALALVFAVCRGFGFQNLLEEQLQHYFPAQTDVISLGLKFVDSYLNNASEGIFVGVGILFLLWTLFSLMSNVEEAFNEAWNIKEGRSLWRKITDYTAIFFVLPVLVICSSGISVVMSTTLQYIIQWEILKPAVSWILDLISVALIWLFFTGTFLLIPHTPVRFKNALVAGILTGTGYMILQWVFVTGQLYVAKYNAIYGSFSFLPLLLIWLQLVWIITLAGASVCYALQNIYNLSYINKVDNISIGYREKVALAVMTVIVQYFDNERTAPSPQYIAKRYAMPSNLVAVVVNRLEACGLVKRVSLRPEYREPGLVPAMSTDHITINYVLNHLDRDGDSGFIPGFEKRFGAINRLYDQTGSRGKSVAGDTRLSDISLTHKQKNQNP